LVAILQFAHKRRQVFRKRGASGIGEFGLQSGRKCLHEFHRVERANGQIAHLSAPPSPMSECDRGDFVPPARARTLFDQTTRSEEGPGRRGLLDRGLSVSPGIGGCWGNAAHIISVDFQSSKKGRRRRDGSAPLPPSPTTRSGNNDDEIAAGLGRALMKSPSHVRFEQTGH
jgi:hypothetical protein